MQLSKAHIASYLPHGPSMVLLDSVIHCDTDTICAGVDSHRDPAHPLRHEGRLGASASIEFAAQAVAVHAQLHMNNADPTTPTRTGKIASVRKVQLHKRYLDDVAGQILVFAQRVHSDDSALLYTFQIEGDGAEIAQGTLTIHLN